jgi:hypothetical protein
MAVEQDAAALGGQHAHDGLDGGGLAHAVAADQGYDLARGDVQVHAEQHFARAVAGLQLLELQHQSSSPR